MEQKIGSDAEHGVELSECGGETDSQDNERKEGVMWSPLFKGRRERQC